MSGGILSPRAVTAGGERVTECYRQWVLKNSFQGVSAAKFVRKLLIIRSPRTQKLTEITALVPFSTATAFITSDSTSCQLTRQPSLLTLRRASSPSVFESVLCLVSACRFSSGGLRHQIQVNENGQTISDDSIEILRDTDVLPVGCVRLCGKPSS
jgi:hypothetical protein